MKMSSINVMKWSGALVLGAVAGYAYYHFFGCEGSCAITSSPVRSSLYGAMMGGLFRWSLITK
ncbi:MAG: hypothetical protein EP332_12505 [Bacteroidetes bacterium]|nr:MAG: hypothetical protein EP332_12505 [Bacteroidota bacterium]